jgi:hypothetical protein
MAKLAGGKIDGKSQIVVNDGNWGPNRSHVCCTLVVYSLSSGWAATGFWGTFGPTAS